MKNHQGAIQGGIYFNFKSTSIFALFLLARWRHSIHRTPLKRRPADDMTVRMKVQHADMIQPGNLVLSDADFAMLRDRVRPIHAVNVNGGNGSYRIEAGDTQDAVLLKDRREAAREAVGQ